MVIWSRWVVTEGHGHLVTMDGDWESDIMQMRGIMRNKANKGPQECPLGHYFPPPEQILWVYVIPSTVNSMEPLSWVRMIANGELRDLSSKW